jgi:O-antigen ligase
MFWLQLFIVASVILVLSADLRYAESGGAEVSGLLVGSTTSRQVSFLLLGGLGALLLLGRPAHKQVPVWHVLVPAALLLGFLCASTLWSDDPATTLKRAIVVVCIAAAGFGMGKMWDFRQFSCAILILSSFFLLLGLGAELHYRAWASDPASYRFSGLFHPAKQAFSCGMLVLASLSLFLMERRKIFLLITAVALAFLVLTKARTGLAATGIAVGVLVWPYLSSRAVLPVCLCGAFLTAALLTIFGATGTVVEVNSLATMGRDQELADPTKLTGRLPIWNHALGLFAEQPIFGYGYGAFWTERRLNEFERRNGWQLAHSHSSYIEALVNLGFVGFILGFLLALTVFVRCLRLSVAGQPSARLVAALFTLAFVAGLTETAFVGDGYEILALVIGTGLVAFEPAISRASYRYAMSERFRRPAQLGWTSHPSAVEAGS